MANSEGKTCQNCRNQFTIESEDFRFYEKIKVPPPTWCPECRLQRRMMWRNERTLYKRKCQAPGHSEEILSIYSPALSLTVYDHDFWWSDGWHPLEYGHNHDFSRPFFEQLRKLFETVPLVNFYNTNPQNSNYCNHTVDLKDCYLIFGSIFNENVSYGSDISYSRDSLDLYMSEKMEGCYFNL